MSDGIVDAADLAARAELGWRDAGGHLHAVAFTPLVIDGTVTAALSFDLAATARSLAGATSAVLVLSDSRMAFKGWRPLAARVDLHVTADVDGAWTRTGAVDQEVRKFPPSRLLLDTPMQRREHWWYVPRWIVRMHVRTAAYAVARRAGPADAVMFEDAGEGLRAYTAAVDDWRADPLQLIPLRDGGLAASPPVPALAFTHDFAIPDMQRRCAYEVAGMRHGRRMSVTLRRGEPALDRPAGLTRRLRGHWRWARACRRAVVAYEGASSSAAGPPSDGAPSSDAAT